MTKQAMETKAYIENQEAEEKKLLKIIAEADAERLKQKKEFDKVGISNLSFQIPCILLPHLSSVFLRWFLATVNVGLLKLYSTIKTKMLRYWSERNL